MAQRTIHYLFGELLLREIPLPEAPRFLLGSLLPDAFVSREDRDVTHFAVKTETLSWVDYDAFAARFPALLRTDALYLGYYMHLLEDDCYRQLLHGKYFDRFNITTDRDLEDLYRDYTILNSVIRREFGLSSRLGPTPEDESAKTLYTAIAPLDPAGMKAELEHDFSYEAQGELRFLTFDLLEDFLHEWLPVCVGELRALLAGAPTRPAQSFAWKRRAKYN